MRHVRVWCFALLAAGLRGQDDADAAKLVAEASKRLAAIGYQVPEGIGISSRRASEVTSDIDPHQDLLFPPGTYALQPRCSWHSA